MASVRRLEAEPLTEVCTGHGEGAVWDADAGVLRFVDMLAGDLLTFDPASGGVERRHLGAVAACVRPRTGGGLAVALERSVVLLAPPGAAAPRELSPVFTEAGVRFNEGGCDPAGRFWMGTMAADEAPDGGTLYRIDTDGVAAVALAPVGVSNGLSFAADGRSAHYVDTSTGRVDVLDVDPASGHVTGRRPFVEVPPDAGGPDGIAVDAEGGVWVALWGGSAVHRYDATGRLDAVVRVGARQVTCPALGGPELTDLYVTTSRQGLDDADDPLAGAVFRVPVDVPGVPVLPYGG